MLLIALALAAGCGPREPREPDSPEVAECRREARADPEMALLFRSAAPDQAWRLTEDRRQLENRLIRACLERKGLLRPGVEPVQPIR